MSPTLSHLRISSTMLCIQSVYCLYLLAGRRQPAVVGYLKSYAWWCCDVGKGVKNDFAHPADLISGFLNDILQQCLIFIRRQVLDTPFKRGKPSDLFLHCSYRAWICLYLCIQIYVFALDPMPRQISNNINHMNLPEDSRYSLLLLV